MKKKFLIGLLILAILAGSFFIAERLVYSRDTSNLHYRLSGINPYFDSISVCTKEPFSTGGYSIVGDIDVNKDEINIKIKGIRSPRGGVTLALAPACLKKRNLRLVEGKIYMVTVKSKGWIDSYEMLLKTSEEGCLYNTTFYKIISTHTEAIGGEKNKCSLFFYCASPTSMEDCKLLLSILQNSGIKVIKDLSTKKGYGEGKYDLQIKSSDEALKIITDFVCSNKNESLKIHLMNGIIKSVAGIVYRDDYLNAYEDLSMVTKISC